MNSKEAANVLIQHRDLLRTNSLFNSNAGNYLTMALDVAIKRLVEARA